MNMNHCWGIESHRRVHIYILSFLSWDTKQWVEAETRTIIWYVDWFKALPRKKKTNSKALDMIMNSNIAHHYSNKSCSNSFDRHTKFRDDSTGTISKYNHFLIVSIVKFRRA